MFLCSINYWKKCATKRRTGLMHIMMHGCALNRVEYKGTGRQCSFFQAKTNKKLFPSGSEGPPFFSSDSGCSQVNPRFHSTGVVSAGEQQKKAEALCDVFLGGRACPSLIPNGPRAAHSTQTGMQPGTLNEASPGAGWGEGGNTLSFVTFTCDYSIVLDCFIEGGGCSKSCFRSDRFIKSAMRNNRFA